ncbi:hypothetical protein B0H19DRAFT_1276131 [Mycena capillaripes]|nr:hypothetical protein B0H19DRAFT_1276131 [Mycena capillaripes]
MSGYVGLCLMFAIAKTRNWPVGLFCWGKKEFRFSDPYAGYSYDTLHSDDFGKWGRHLWPSLLDALAELDGKGTFAKNMREFSRWPGLKHFNQVTTIKFTEGQTFYDILKSVLPCIVQILPRNSPLNHCIRARLERLGTFINDYESCCSRVSDRYGKNFDFFKQHATSHIVRDIQDKGTTNHGSTRPGEGFQQEASEAYNQTNVAPQMDRIDETQEAIARIRMAIDRYDNQCMEDEREDEDVEENASTSAVTSAPWRLGAPERITNSRAFAESLKSAGHFVADFDSMLRDLVSENFPEERGISYEQRIQVRPFKCAHITYQSLEDWHGLRHIVRCNPRIHGHTRYECVLVNSDAAAMAFARLTELLRCTLESKRHFDFALVHEFRPSKWKPHTYWAGCQVYEETKEFSLVLMDYMIRGALLTPATDSGKDNLHFFVDNHRR